MSSRPRPQRPDEPSATIKPASDWRALLILFTLAGVVESQAFGHLAAFRPLFLQQLGVPLAQIPFWTGLLASLGFVIGLPLLPFWGVWADRYSRKLIIVRSAYVEGVLFALAALSPNVWALAGAQLLAGFIFGNTGVMLAMLADVTPRKRLGLAVGIASAGFPIGSSVGPLIGGYVAQTFGIRPLLFGDGVASALTGLLLTLAVHEGARRASNGATVATMLRQAARDILSSRLVVSIFGAVLSLRLQRLAVHAVPPHPDPAARYWPQRTVAFAHRRHAGGVRRRDGAHYTNLGTAGRYDREMAHTAHHSRRVDPGHRRRGSGSGAATTPGVHRLERPLPGRSRRDGGGAARAARPRRAARLHPQLLAAPLAAFMVPRPTTGRARSPA